MVLGRLFKLHPAFDDMMFEILRADPCAHVVLISEKQKSWNQQVYVMRQRSERDEKLVACGAPTASYFAERKEGLEWLRRTSSLFCARERKLELVAAAHQRPLLCSRTPSFVLASLPPPT
jgi:hypothetical protein